MRYVLTHDEGIVSVPKSKSKIRKFFCKHSYISGELCSKQGLTIISGQSCITVCRKCGNELSRTFIPY